MPRPPPGSAKRLTGCSHTRTWTMTQVIKRGWSDQKDRASCVEGHAERRPIYFILYTLYSASKAMRRGGQAGQWPLLQPLYTLYFIPAAESPLLQQARRSQLRCAPRPKLSHSPGPTRVQRPGPPMAAGRVMGPPSPGGAPRAGWTLTARGLKRPTGRTGLSTCRA